MSDEVRLGAYVLAADPTWLRSSISRYYDRLDVLVVSAAASGRGWTGRPIASKECVDLCRSLDTRGIVKVVTGEWTDADAMRAETAQRQAALDAVGTEVDWVLQIDTDEVLPDPDAFVAVMGLASTRGIGAIEWPMRVLYRRLGDGRYLQVSTTSGTATYEYPGPVAVRPGTVLREARRVQGSFLRPIVRGDAASHQLHLPPEPGEQRAELVDDTAAILHNSWAREPASVRRKIASWSHNQGPRSWWYYWTVWWPAPLRWRRMRDFHPLAPQLWPALTVRETPPPVVDGADGRTGPRTNRAVRRIAWRSRAGRSVRESVRG